MVLVLGKRSSHKSDTEFDTLYNPQIASDGLPLGILQRAHDRSEDTATSIADSLIEGIPTWFRMKVGYFTTQEVIVRPKQSTALYIGITAHGRELKNESDVLFSL
jgi:hypothetical protein